MSNRVGGLNSVAVEPQWRDLMPCYLALVGRDLRIVDCNKLFRSVFGDYVGDFCYRACRGRETPCTDCSVGRTLRDGEVHTNEETMVDRNGQARSVVVTTAPVVDADGGITGAMMVATDISELTSLRRELDRSRREYERLFTAVPCFICVQDRQHRITKANELYREEFGADYGSRCWEVCKKRNTQCPDCLVDRTFADGKVYSSEETLVARDGRRINAIVHTRPVYSDDGEISEVMEVFTDITEVKNLQRQLTLMGRAVAGMAHRVKNILMGLDGGIFVVNTGLETDDRKAVAEGWEMVERNVQRVSRIVKDLLYCSKERAPQFQEEVCPQAIVRDVKDLYATRVADQDIELETELSEPDHRGVFDPEGLHSLLCNLVANAIDACRFDPSDAKVRHTIIMRCQLDEQGTTLLEVEDDGAGIPEDANNKVFEDFFSSKGTEGTGIGLLVVQKVAEEHGGQVTFSSRPGRGTTFTVTIPTVVS